jgi:enoyl-CoA hydratase/carnithine racemase
MDLDKGLEYQLREFLHVFGTEERVAGMKAFFEKRRGR